MKVAFVITNLKGGGAEKAVLRIAGALADRGNDVSVVLLEQLLDHPALEGLTLHALTSQGKAATKGWIGKRISAWRLRFLFLRLERGKRFDLVVSALPYCNEVVALAGITPAWFRIDNTLSGELELLRRNTPGKARRRHARYRRLYEGKNLLAVSDGVARDLRASLGLADANIVRIYNPVDTKALRALAALPEPALPKEPYLIHVGRFAPQKRHDLLFEALRCSQLPHRLVLLTNSSPSLERLIADYDLNGRVTVAGFQPNPYPWVAGADLLVLCSDHEGMPNVLIEALACGTRVVSTDCPSGPREALKGDLARFLVRCDDAEALARTMCDALASPRPVEMRSLDRFSGETIAQQYEALPGRR